MKDMAMDDKNIKKSSSKRVNYFGLKSTEPKILKELLCRFIYEILGQVSK